MTTLQVSRQALERVLLVPEPLFLPLVGHYQAPQTGNAPLDPSAGAGAGDGHGDQRGEADRRHEALGLEPVAAAEPGRVVVHAVHVAHGILRERAPERDAGFQLGFVVVVGERLHFRGRGPRGAVRHEGDADAALGSEVGSSGLFGAVGARDAQDRWEVEQGLGGEVVEELGGVFGDGHEVVGSDEAVPAAAAAFEEVEKGAETAAPEALLGAERGLEIDCREVSRGACAEQRT